MHPLLRVAIAAQFVIAALYGFIVADGVEDIYPAGASSAIAVTKVPPGADPTAKFLSIVDSSGVSLAKTVYSAGPAGTVRTLAFAGAPSRAPDWVVSGKYPRFGPTRRTRAITFDPSTTGDSSTAGVIGRWVVYGSDATATALDTRLADGGFTIEVQANDFGFLIQVIQSSLSSILPLAGFAAMFVAALLSASRSSRVRAVRMLYGWRLSSTIFKEAVGYTANIVVLGLVTLALWAGAARVLWGGTQLFDLAGRIVAAAIALTAVVAVIAAVAGVAVVALAVTNPRDQIAGVRPFRLIYAASAVTSVLVLLGTFSALDRSRSTAELIREDQQALSIWSTEPAARMLSIQYTDEEVVQQSYRGYKSFVEQFAADRRVLLSFAEARCNDLHTLTPCVFVNDAYLDRVPLSASDGRRIGAQTGAANTIKLLLPDRLATDQAHLRGDLDKWVSLQRTLDRTANPTATSIDVTTLQAGQTVPIFGSPESTTPASIPDPIIIVLPDASGLPSADFHLAAASTGNEIYFASNDELAAAIHRTGVGALVMSIDRPTDVAQSRIAQTRVVLLQSGITLAIGLVTAVLLIILLAATYCERLRKPLFVRFLHGASAVEKYGQFYLLYGLIAALTWVAMSMAGLWPSTEAYLLRAGVIISLGIVALPALLINDLRFRANFIKRP